MWSRDYNFPSTSFLANVWFFSSFPPPKKKIGTFWYYRITHVKFYTWKVFRLEGINERVEVNSQPIFKNGDLICKWFYIFVSEKVYFRSQILECPSIGQYWNIFGVPVLPENVILTFFRTCWCYSEAYNTGTQKWSSIVQYSCTSIWDLKYTFSFVSYHKLVCFPLTAYFVFLYDFLVSLYFSMIFLYYWPVF